MVDFFLGDIGFPVSVADEGIYIGGATERGFS